MHSIDTVVDFKIRDYIEGVFFFNIALFTLHAPLL